MTSISRSALVMHSAQQMFDLVNDVQTYPEYMPGCVGVSLISQSDELLSASLTLAKAGIKYSITTSNELKRPESMVMSLVDGPFKEFKGVWTFKALSDEACKVSLEMEFEVNSKVAGIAIGSLFKQVATSMVDVFVKRAEQIYE